MGWAATLKDAILSNEGLRDGLNDPEAQMLLDWGLIHAERVGGQLDLLSPDEAELALEDRQGLLLKFLTRVVWIAVKRTEAGPEWTLQTLQKINTLYVELYGEGVPQLEAAQMTAYSQMQDGLGPGELLKTLMQQLSIPGANNHEQTQQFPIL
jgi:hypothetical protein